MCGSLEESRAGEKRAALEKGGAIAARGEEMGRPMDGNSGVACEPAAAISMPELEAAGAGTRLHGPRLALRTARRHTEKGLAQMQPLPAVFQPRGGARADVRGGEDAAAAQCGLARPRPGTPADMRGGEDAAAAPCRRAMRWPTGRAPTRLRGA